jgi:preprotein translocase subunit SecE
LARFDPLGYLREVRHEVSRVTGPRGRRRSSPTGLVLALSALAAGSPRGDQLIRLAMRTLFGFG